MGIYSKFLAFLAPGPSVHEWCSIFVNSQRVLLLAGKRGAVPRFRSLSSWHIRDSAGNYVSGMSVAPGEPFLGKSDIFKNKHEGHRLSLRHGSCHCFFGQTARFWV
jgi:hypothetical protein